MAQNTKALSYLSTVMFLISFTLHNIPIGYKIISITELHLYSMLITKIEDLKEFNCTVMSYA